MIKRQTERLILSIGIQDKIYKEGMLSFKGLATHYEAKLEKNDSV